MDSLSQHPNVTGEKDSDSDSEEHGTISCATVWEELEEIIDGDKIPIECQVAIQNKPAQQELELHSSVIKVLSTVPIRYERCSTS